jgi:hypothetical protein
MSVTVHIILPFQYDEKSNGFTCPKERQFRRFTRSSLGLAAVGGDPFEMPPLLCVSRMRARVTYRRPLSEGLLKTFLANQHSNYLIIVLPSLRASLSDYARPAIPTAFSSRL